MQYPGSQARQTPQTGRIIQITRQWNDPALTQGDLIVRRGGQGQHPRTAQQRQRHALTNVPAPHDQDAFASETGRQGAKRCLV